MSRTTKNNTPVVWQPTKLYLQTKSPFQHVNLLKPDTAGKLLNIRVITNKLTTLTTLYWSNWFQFVAAYGQTKTLADN